MTIKAICDIKPPQTPEERFNWLLKRNVCDSLKHLSDQEIKLHLQKTNNGFAILMSQLEHDFNFSSVVRNANAFNAKEVFYFGSSKKWDRRGAVGTQLYTTINFLSSLEEVLALKEKYTLIALDCLEGISKPIENFVWPNNPLIIIGEECNGIPKEFLEMCDDVVHITQHGSVRSMNAAVASGIAMFSYMTSKKV